MKDISSINLKSLKKQLSKKGYHFKNKISSGGYATTITVKKGFCGKKRCAKIFVDGNDISKMNDDKLAVFRRRQVGIVYQFYNLIPILTVEENITLPCDLDGRGVDRERLEMILDSFGLRARRKHLPNQLSGGQQQRTSIARALINNPSLVLADEPTGNLDSKSSEEVMSMLKMCNQSYGQTVIMITHNLDIAKQADRIITISDGKIVEEA